MKWIPTQLPHTQPLQQLANELSTEQPFPIALANILMQRGITTYQQAKNFFVPQKTDLYDPFLMKGMKEATERVLQAKRNHEKGLIYGDYDVDGTTSVAWHIVSSLCL